MSRTSHRVKALKKPKFAKPRSGAEAASGIWRSVRQHNRCPRCGRPRAFLRKFRICRLCFRSLALLGEIPGVRKASW